MDFKTIKNHIRKDNNHLLKFINKSEIDWLNKHFAFINALLMGRIKRTEKKYQNFIDVIQNKKQPTSEEERIYLKFTEYFDEVIKKQKIKQKDPNILFNGMEDPPGTRQYPKEMIDKLNTEYEKESYFEWVDDWKYR